MARRTAWAVAALAMAACTPGPDDGDPGGGIEGSTRWRDYIRGSPYRRLVIEVDRVPGEEPAAGVDSSLVTQLRLLLDKPGGIGVSYDETIPSRGASHAWTFQELDALATQTFNLQVPADTTKMHVLWIDGHSSEDTESGWILGLAWSHTHLVMFKDSVRRTCGSHPSRAQREKLCAGAELAVWTHEIGHLLGLVDNGLPMVTNHRDPDPAHGRHDVNTDCVMYWAHEGQEAVNTVARKLERGDASAIGFDAECLADLRAVRNAP